MNFIFRRFGTRCLCSSSYENEDGRNSVPKLRYIKLRRRGLLQKENTTNILQGGSLARGPKLLSMYTVEQCGFLVRKYWQTGSFKACQTAFRTEFGERRAPSKCCIQKLVKKLKTRGSRSNAWRLLSLGPIEGQNVQKYTPHNRTTQRRYTPRDSSRQRRHFGKIFQNLKKSIQVCLDVKGNQF